MASGANGGNNRDVFVLIKAERCGFCGRLTPHIPEIKKHVEGRGMNFIEYEVAEMFKPPNGPNGKYPDSIGHTGIWYPFIFHTTSDNWKNIVAGKDLKSQISILNGSFNGKEYVLGRQTYNPMKISDISAWLDSITSKATITNAVIAPRTLNSLSTNKQRSPVANKGKTETDIRMKIIPRKKYGR